MFYFLEKYITINPPVAHTGKTPLSFRLLSGRMRPGTEWTRELFFSRLFQSNKPNVDHLDWCTSNLRSQSKSTRFFRSRRSLSTFFINTFMFDEDRVEQKTDLSSPSSPSSPNNSQASSCLIFYIHGGGFISMNSKSQDVICLFGFFSYLRLEIVLR